MASAMSVPRVRSGGRDGLGDQVERRPVAVEVRGEAALVAEAGGQALLLQHRLERVVDLGALAQRLAEGRRPDGRDHELLDVHVGVGVRAAVQDVHHAAPAAGGRSARRRSGRAAARPSRPRRGRPPARRRGWRSRRGWPCWASRRVRASSGRSRRWSSAARPSTRRADLLDHGVHGLADALAAVAGRRRRAARRPRRRRWTRRWAPSPAANVPSSSSTSTSTVGLPRESRISRAPTASMDATVTAPGDEGRSGQPSGCVGTSSADHRPEIVHRLVFRQSADPSPTTDTVRSIPPMIERFHMPVRRGLALAAVAALPLSLLPLAPSTATDRATGDDLFSRVATTPSSRSRLG